MLYLLLWIQHLLVLGRRKTVQERQQFGIVWNDFCNALIHQEIVLAYNTHSSYIACER